jgi:uncharacterized protein YndB with AHSA1/START domain
VPAVCGTRTLAATPEQLWQVIADPHHLPRWWPRVSRVEGVDEDAFTEVLVSDKGKVVRADFRRVQEQPPRKLVWAQQIEGTPFARVLKSAETEIVLTPVEPTPVEPTRGALADSALGGPVAHALPAGQASSLVAAGAWPTEVTIELRQGLRGFEWSERWGWGHRSGWGAFWRGGSYLVRRAASATIEEALDGLERIVGH